MVMQAEGLPHDLQAASDSFSLQQDLLMLEQHWGCMALHTTPNFYNSAQTLRREASEQYEEELPSVLLQGSRAASPAAAGHRRCSGCPPAWLNTATCAAARLTWEFHSHSSVLPSTSDSTSVTGLPSSGGPRFLARARRNMGRELRIHTAATLANTTSTPKMITTMAMGVSPGGMALHLHVSSSQGLQGV